MATHSSQPDPFGLPLDVFWVISDFLSVECIVLHLSRVSKQLRAFFCSQQFWEYRYRFQVELEHANSGIPLLKSFTAVSDSTRKTNWRRKFVLNCHLRDDGANVRVLLSRGKKRVSGSRSSSSSTESRKRRDCLARGDVLTFQIVVTNLSWDECVTITNPKEIASGLAFEQLKLPCQSSEFARVVSLSYPCSLAGFGTKCVSSEGGILGSVVLYPTFDKGAFPRPRSRSRCRSEDSIVLPPGYSWVVRVRGTFLTRISQISRPSNANARARGEAKKDRSLVRPIERETGVDGEFGGNLGWAFAPASLSRGCGWTSELAVVSSSPHSTQHHLRVVVTARRSGKEAGGSRLRQEQFVGKVCSSRPGEAVKPDIAPTRSESSVEIRDIAMTSLSNVLMLK